MKDGEVVDAEVVDLSMVSNELNGCQLDIG